MFSTTRTARGLESSDLSVSLQDTSLHEKAFLILFIVITLETGSVDKHDDISFDRKERERIVERDCLAPKKGEFLHPDDQRKYSSFRIVNLRDVCISFSIR